MSEMESNFNAHREVSGFLSLVMNGTVITPQQAKEVYRLRQYMGKLNYEERNALIPAMKKLCEGLPILKIREVIVNRDEFENGHIDISNRTVSKSRKKRFTLTSCEVHNTCTLDPVKGGKYCKWYICKTVDVGGNCNMEHIRDGTWKCVSCCRKIKDGRMCKCDTIVDEDTFRECQNVNFG